jgi:hypothetical protein
MIQAIEHNPASDGTPGPDSSIANDKMLWMTGCDIAEAVAILTETNSSLLLDQSFRQAPNLATQNNHLCTENPANCSQS